MTKTIVTPENSEVLLSVPAEYIGKKVEVLMYAVEEIAENKQPVNAAGASKSNAISEEAKELHLTTHKQEEIKNTFVSVYAGTLKHHIPDIDAAKDKYLKEKYGL